MAVSFLPQAQIRAGNPLLDLAQLNQGLASVQRSNELQADRAMREQQMAADEKQQNRLMALREQQMAQSAQQNAIENRRADETMSMRRAEFSAQQQARQREMDMQKAQKAARLAGMVSGNQERWDALRRMVPDINEDLPADIANDPVLGPQALQAMVFGPPNERDQLELERLRAQTRAAQGLADQRAQKAAAGDADNMTGRVSEGLQNLANVTTDFDPNTFQNAVGTLQGDDDGGISTSIARTFGSVVNALPYVGGSGNTTQVRRRIAGDTEALAAAIKPLIRKPGEGPWTDADQRRLVAVVGDLSLANNQQEYMQALEGIRQRLRANFGLELPPIGSGGAAQEGGQAPRRLRYNMETGELE